MVGRRRITTLDVIRERAVREVEITLAGQGTGEAGDARSARPARQTIRAIVAVSLVVELNGQANLRVRAATARAIRPSDLFVRDVEALCGAGRSA
jgi:hypothetical protein